VLTVEALRRILGLGPHPVEGGYFVETYRSAEDVPASGLPSRYGEAGQRLQVVVPRHTWQGARLIPGGRYALLGTTVAPGFDYADYETAPRAPLLASHPGAKDLILALTR
jgi:predicted cupin superfamily sugar epimerase